MHFTSLCLILACALFCARADEVRVLTFNIRYANQADEADYWDHRREAAARLIAEQADVAGLQEVLPAQRADLAARLPEFAFVGLGREADDAGEGCPIFFRKDRFTAEESGTFWLSATPEQPGSKGWGAKLPRICTWVRLRDAQGGAFFIFNTHLDHETQPARVQSIPLIQQRMAARRGNEPALLLGDFNMGPNNPAFAPLTLVSTYRALGVPAEGTFHAFTGKARGAAIDFIFFEKDRWTVKSGAVLKTTYRAADGTDRFVSDHFPVTAVLTAGP
jgi:endonuclease/exonuclease/phosphatase family metal-dependent hydrolase